MEKIKQLLGSPWAASNPESLQRSFNELFARQNLVSATVAVTGAAAATWKITGTATYLIDGHLYQKTTANFPSLAGYNLTSAQVGLVVGAVDAAGNLTNFFAPPASGISSIVFPTIPVGYAVVGFVLINTGATFTGNTTAMDTAGISYFNTVGPFHPYSLF